ncbi:sensor domain-containing diguanylate cyclase [Kaistia dalseonensis]|nr:sensor domain-containing diguanylate cyclase [Kaistia dalseonensis]MCX5494554.1 sensor domain-containing diguanylate cyclase [Kaistia dalseonensis]
MFDLAPVALWLEDYSELKSHFDHLAAAGVTSLRTYLVDDLARVKACSDRIRLVKVNRRTLSLFEADNFEDLTENLGRVFRDDMLPIHIDELVRLWDGETEFASNTVNYTLSGKRLDILLRGAILPGYEQCWSRVLVSTESVTERETAQRQLAASEAYARGLFDHSPVSLWVEDFSAVKQLIDDIRQRGILDFRTFTDVHPEFVTRCMSEIRVVDVNRHTLELFGAADKKVLLRRLGDVFRDKMELPFREQLIDLWAGKLFQQREVVNYTLDGRELYLMMQFSVLPGHEKDWSLVQVALTDITARKAAEAYLEFLGKHDALTKLYNRSFYIDEINRLQRNGPKPVTVILADLNGLKETNDQHGHAAGDEMLRRVGEVLGKLAERPAHAARIGGDEFAVILPGVNETEAQTIMEKVQMLVELNNQYYSKMPISLSCGAATSRHDEPLEEVTRRADRMMYEAKRAYYATPALDRERTTWLPLPVSPRPT